MEKKIEENTPRTHPKHECDDIRTKTFFNSEKYTGTKCGICDTILEFNWKVTPSSLPTDEEIIKQVLLDMGNPIQKINSTSLDHINYNYTMVKKIMQALRTNFSSEKCEGENEIAFGDWLLKNFDSGLYGWVRKKEAGKIYPACYNPPLSTIEVIEIFKNRNTNPPKQEQQTTK